MLFGLNPPTRLARRVGLEFDPMRRVRLPADITPLVTIGHESAPTEVGMAEDSVEKIWRQAIRLYRWRLYPALTLCIRREGQVVLNRSVGWSHGDGASAPLATPETPFCVFSTSKAITATVIHLLDERGVLRIGDRVCDYIPEFTGDGREQITVEQVLSHRAGIPAIPANLSDLSKLSDPAFLLEAICHLPVRSRAGSHLAYHAVSGGFVLAEVVRRVTGQDIRTVLAEQILNPLSFRWTNYGVLAQDLPLVGESRATGMPVLPPLSHAFVRAFGMSTDEVTHAANDPRFLTATIPSANVVSTANELARFMELLRLGGTMDGVQVIKPATIRRALVERSYHKFDHTLGAPVRHAAGYMLGAKRLSVYGPDTDDAFGHLGYSNVMAWADPRRAISVGLITSGKPILGPHIPDLRRLTARIGAAAPKVESPALLG